MPGLMAQNGVVQAGCLLYEQVSALVEDDRPGVGDQLGQSVLVRPFVDRLPQDPKVEDVLDDLLDRHGRRGKRTELPLVTTEEAQGQSFERLVRRQRCLHHPLDWPP